MQTSFSFSRSCCSFHLGSSVLMRMCSAICTVKDMAQGAGQAPRQRAGGAEEIPPCGTTPTSDVVENTFRMSRSGGECEAYRRRLWKWPPLGLRHGKCEQWKRRSTLINKPPPPSLPQT